MTDRCLHGSFYVEYFRAFIEMQKKAKVSLWILDCPDGARYDFYHSSSYAPSVDHNGRSHH